MVEEKKEKKSYLWKSCDGVWYTNNNELVFQGKTRYNDKDFMTWLGNEVDHFCVDNKGYHVCDNNVKIDFRDFMDFVKALTITGIVQEIIEV